MADANKAVVMVVQQNASKARTRILIFQKLIVSLWYYLILDCYPMAIPRCMRKLNEADVVLVLLRLRHQHQQKR